MRTGGIFVVAGPGIAGRSNRNAVSRLAILRAMGTPLRAGHWLNDHEMLDEVLVNETFAKTVARNGDVIGRRIRGSFVNGTIAGVVDDFKYAQLDAEPLPEVYASYELAPLMIPYTLDVFVRMADGGRPDAHAS